MKIIMKSTQPPGVNSRCDPTLTEESNLKSESDIALFKLPHIPALLAPPCLFRAAVVDDGVRGDDVGDLPERVPQQRDPALLQILEQRQAVLRLPLPLLMARIWKHLAFVHLQSKGFFKILR